MDYKKARDLAWDVLIRNDVRFLPLDLEAICKGEGINLITYKNGIGFIKSLDLEEHILDNDAFSFGNMIFYDSEKPHTRQRFSIAHEIGHILLHINPEARVYHRVPHVFSSVESEANVFASRLLMPLSVLHLIDLDSPEEIAELCDVGISTAVVRFKRLCQVRHNSSARRKEKNYGTFMLSSKERAVCDNFKDFIAAEREKRGKKQTKTSGLNDSSKEASTQKSDVIIE